MSSLIAYAFGFATYIFLPQRLTFILGFTTLYLACDPWLIIHWLRGNCSRSFSQALNQDRADSCMNQYQNLHQ